MQELGVFQQHNYKSCTKEYFRLTIRNTLGTPSLTKKKKKKINSHHYIFRDLDGHQVSTHKPFSLPGQIMQLHRIPGIVALSLKNCYSLHSRPKKTKVQINATACSTKTNLIKHTRLSQLTFYHVQICVWLIAHYWLVPWKFITLFDTQLKRDKFMSHWH